MSYNKVPELATSQNSKFSIRKNKEMMRQSKLGGFESNRNVQSSREVPTIELNTFDPREKAITGASERFIFDEKRMEVSYFCGCCSLPNLTRSEIYIAPSQIISRRALLKADDVFDCDNQ